MHALFRVAMLALGSTAVAGTVEPPAPPSGVYEIVTRASGLKWHENGGGDRLVSTRFQPDDAHTRFWLEPQADGSFRITVLANGRHLHVDHGGDKLLSTRYQPDDDFTRFFFHLQDDGSWRIRVKGSNEFLHEDDGDRLISTRQQPDDDFTRFFLNPQTETHGMTGHLSVAINVSQPLPGVHHGMSYYGRVHQVQAVVAGMQFGWGTWVTPDNQQFDQGLCIPGTVAYDNWPDQAPWRHLFQTIEGGPGRWASSRFPWSSPKFRVNAVPDCYTNEVASPGWSFHGQLLPPDFRLGLAMLANRLLLPPEGMPFLDTARAPVAGFGWIALPLLPANLSPEGAPTGDQSWTLFLHTRNFRGPVAFFVPAFWSVLHGTDGPAVGRGLDAQPLFIGSMALEVGITPMFTALDAEGGRWRRIPRMEWPADGSGKAVMLQDIRYYAKQAIWDGIAAWKAGGSAVDAFDADGIDTPTLDGSNMGVTLGGDPVSFDDAYTAGVVQAADGSDAIGMQWGGTLESGVFPEYYHEDGDTWRPVPAAEVPAETGLSGRTFAAAPVGEYPPLDLAPESPWSPTGWAAGPCTAALADGSLVDYAWFRFVDQPAIARLDMGVADRDALQAFVASIHENMGFDGPTIPPPGSGTLAPLDYALLVTPPQGFEAGYVPIVIAQRTGGVMREAAVFGAGFEVCLTR
ncbi:MAG TPA: hypothetical protein PKZ76_01315 [Xanthomonadaceae bacterium]|nr:hypothetical protein [Xanthomonadaceae bacterium]